MNSKFKAGDILRDLVENQHNHGYLLVKEMHTKNDNYIVESFKTGRILNWDRSATDNTCELATDLDKMLYYRSAP